MRILALGPQMPEQLPAPATKSTLYAVRECSFWPTFARFIVSLSSALDVLTPHVFNDLFVQANKIYDT